jgi:rare lipoprotein A
LNGVVARYRTTVLATCTVAAVLTACGGPPPVREFSPGYPVGYTERGVASWYGPGFHGNRTANGERFDMNQMTAAHRTLPIGSILSVRSLTNGRQVTVRVNDRGPFARGRILDLSQAAAQSLAMTANGTDSIELKVVAFQGRPGAFGFLRIQVGSFAELANAQALAARLKGRYGEVRIVPVELASGKFYRVQVGQYGTERQAQAIADDLDARFNVESLIIRDDV